MTSLRSGKHNASVCCPSGCLSWRHYGWQRGRRSVKSNCCCLLQCWCRRWRSTVSGRHLTRHVPVTTRWCWSRPRATAAWGSGDVCRSTTTWAVLPTYSTMWSCAAMDVPAASSPYPTPSCSVSSRAAKTSSPTSRRPTAASQVSYISSLKTRNPIYKIPWWPFYDHLIANNMSMLSMSIILDMPEYFFSKTAPFRGDPFFHLKHCSLGPLDYTSQTAARSVQAFCSIHTV